MEHCRTVQVYMYAMYVICIYIYIHINICMYAGSTIVPLKEQSHNRNSSLLPGSSALPERRWDGSKTSPQANQRCRGWARGWSGLCGREFWEKERWIVINSQSLAALRKLFQGQSRCSHLPWHHGCFSMAWVRIGWHLIKWIWGSDVRYFVASFLLH